MVIVKKQVNKKNQRKHKKGKKAMQVKKEEDNDNETMGMVVSGEEEDDRDFQSDKAENKEHDLELKEDDENEDSDEGFLKEKLSILKKKAIKLKVNKEKKLKKAKKGKQERNIQNNENKALMKVNKDVKSNKKTERNTKKSQEQKDARSLFIGKLPNDVTKQDLKDLSKDIVEVYTQKKDGPNSRFAFIRFDDEATAKANYSVLKRMKIKDQPFVVDYVGRKSSYNDVKLRKERNARKLYVGDLPTDITEKELRKLSEDVVEIFLSQGKRRFAFLIFDSEDKAKSNYEVFKDKKIRGQPIVVDLTLSRDSIKTDKRSQEEHDGQTSAKKIRR